MELIAALIGVIPSILGADMMKGVILSSAIGGAVVAYYKYIPNKLKINSEIIELETSVEELEKKLEQKCQYLETQIKNKVSKQELNEYLIDVKTEFREFKESFNEIRDKLHFLLAKSGVDLEQIL